MKKVISAISALILTIVTMTVCGIDAFAVYNYAQGFDGDTSKSGLYDGVDVFPDDREESLVTAIQASSEELRMNIYVYISDSYMSDYQTEIFADDTYDEMYGEDTDGIFYYLDLSGKSPAYDYISTSGKAVLLYQDKIDAIFNYLDNYLPASGQSYSEGDIYNAVSAFLSILRTYSDNTPKSSLKYYHDTSSGKYFYYTNGEYIVTKSKPPALWLIIITVCACIGSLTGFITYWAAKSRYKFKSTTNPSVYISHNETLYTQRSDTLIRTYVHKHKIESSGGGGRGGGGGGGHSHSGGHGGGGHHR